MGQPYGYDPNYDGNTEHFHHGIDWPVPVGEPVYAPAPGIVIIARPDWPLDFPGVAPGAWGNYVEIDLGGGYSVGVAHLSAIWTHEGASVSIVEVIGQSGSTGLSFTTKAPPLLESGFVAARLSAPWPAVYVLPCASTAIASPESFR